MSELIEAMFAAHVSYELARWHGPPLARTLEEQVAALFRWLADVKLDDVATREQILGVIERYVSEFRMGGGIAELSGEMSHVVMSSPTSARARVDDILPDASYAQFAAKVVALESVWREIVTLVSASPAFNEVSSQVISRTLIDVVFERASTGRALRPELSGKLAKRILPGAVRRLSSALSHLLQQQRQHFARHIEKHLSEAFEPAQIRAVLDDVWDAVSAKHLSEVFAFINGSDIEDLVVLGYEFWLTYRKSSYFRQISSELVDHFFAKYGQESLALLIDDMGVSEQMVAHELTTFLGPILEHALRTDFLEQQIRALLEPFYRSEGLRDVLRDR